MTGALYKAIAPKSQVYQPEAWNHCRIRVEGDHIQIEMNDELIVDARLNQHIAPLEQGKPLKERPRRGHIGFQELSRGGGQVLIRDARIRELQAERQASER